LAEEPFSRLVERVAARTATPGGGSVAALVGALGTALSCMALRFSMKRKDAPAGEDSVLETLERGALEAAGRLSALADEDAAAFEALAQARKLPSGTPTEREARDVAVRAGIERSAVVPMRTAKLCRESMELLDGVIPVLNRNLATDAVSAALLLRAGARCAAWNVLVNLTGDSSAPARAFRDDVERLLARVAELEARATAFAQGAVSA
jgi:formiminotetrahydrofolate cyclodeaminase